MIYRVGFTTNDTEVGIAIWRIEDMIGRACQAIKATKRLCVLTSQDMSNFRFKLYPEYKANRVQPKPVHYMALRDHLISTYDAVVAQGQEADDELGIAQGENHRIRMGTEPNIGGNIVYPETCIVTIDKDLDQIPGWHYNFVKEQMYNIEPLEAARSFYTQVLEGDRTDNVPGCPGIGKVKAPRILDGCESEDEMIRAVVKQYQKACGPHWSGLLLLAGRLLWIRKKPNEEWHINGKVVSKSVLESYLEN